MTADRRSLRDLAVESGVAPEVIDAAEADGTLGLLLIDRLVTEPGTLTQQEVIAESGLGDDAVRFWRALGFPDPDPDDRIFGPRDVEMLQLVDAVVRLQLIERETALQFARVIGSSMERIAQSQVDAIEARVDAGELEGDGELAVQRAQLLLPTVPQILEYVWRRHLQAAARRRMVREALAGDGQRSLTVGFADLVGFTALAQQLDEHELAVVVDRFSATAYDLVASHGGRVVKTIGDEVMFVHPDARGIVDTCVALAVAARRDEALPGLRIGAAWGELVATRGDRFGTPVNLASRLVRRCRPGEVLVCPALAARTPEATRRGVRWLKGFGPTRPGRLRPAPPG